MWIENKVSRFGEFLHGNTARYFNQRVRSWCTINLTLGFVMDKIVDSYRVGFSKHQTKKLFAERKDKWRSWNDHLLHLMAQQEATNSGEELILENIVELYSTGVLITDDQSIQTVSHGLLESR